MIGWLSDLNLKGKMETNQPNQNPSPGPNEKKFNDWLHLSFKAYYRDGIESRVHFVAIRNHGLPEMFDVLLPNGEVHTIHKNQVVKL